MQPGFPFDAVLFDLDGTLVATERFWPEAARAGALRAFAELGIERELPSNEEWMSMVGLSLEVGFEQVFGDLDPRARATLMRACLEEEQGALSAGRASMLPGVPQALEELRARGVRLGIASNCRRDYLTAMMEGVGLARWIEAARCLDSPGIASKAAMLADLLATFDTRSAVMVGDRLVDRDAAWANGLPHVHLSRGYARQGERVECEAAIEGFDQLVPRLARRGTWIEEVLEALDLPSVSCVVGVSGGLASGKTLFARDLARAVARLGRGAAVITLEDYQRPVGSRRSAREAWGAPSEGQALFDYDLERLERERLGPHRAGGQDAALFLEGPLLAHPRLAERLDRLVYLTVSEEVALRRIAGRDARQPRSELVAFLRAVDALHPPAERADLLLDGANPLGPLQAGGGGL